MTSGWYHHNAAAANASTKRTAAPDPIRMNRRMRFTACALQRVNNRAACQVDGGASLTSATVATASICSLWRRHRDGSGLFAGLPAGARGFQPAFVGILPAKNRREGRPARCLTRRPRWPRSRRNSGEGILLTSTTEPSGRYCIASPRVHERMKTLCHPASVGGDQQQRPKFKESKVSGLRDCLSCYSFSKIPLVLF